MGINEIRWITCDEAPLNESDRLYAGVVNGSDYCTVTYAGGVWYRVYNGYRGNMSPVVSAETLWLDDDE